MLTPPRRTAINARFSLTPCATVTRRSRVLLAVFAGVALDGCKDSSGPAYGPPTQLLITAGQSQTGVFRQPTAIVPTVLVTDAQNRPVPKVVVTFQLQSGGGSITSSTDTTDAAGNATPGTWTLGSTYGSKSLTASAAGLQTVTFSATAIAPDAGIQAFSLTDPVNDTLPNDSVGAPRVHDVTQLRGDFKRDSLILTWTFAATITSGSPLMVGYIEFDIDDSVVSGIPPLSNVFGGTANLGVDYIVLATNQQAAVMYVTATRLETPLAAVVSGSTMVIRVPMSLLGNDDGNFGIVGIVGTQDRPTDYFPNSGATAVRPTGLSVNSTAFSRPIMGARSNLGALRSTWQSGISRR